MMILLGRDISKIQPVIDEVHKISTVTVTKFIEIHLDSLASVRKAAQQILNDQGISQIDVLINNAGIMAAPYASTEDGIERQFATNHIGHFLLTNLIMPKLLEASPNARVVNVSSYGNVLSDVLEDPNFSGDGKDYSPFVSYGQSKTANVLFSVGLNERLKGKGLKAFAMDPGSRFGLVVAKLVWLTWTGVPSNLRRFLTPEIMKEGK
jgi:NAD(P)-dependent dehydrogenase (short-subunit alcohol dehydrogenase family)